METIEITNAKTIKKLIFNLPDKNGLYLLTGENGSGKSSLLGVMHRIGFSNAFQRWFPVCQTKTTYDNFTKAKFKYTTDAGTVFYKYTTERWVPTPRSKNTILKSFNYQAVKYIAVDETRIVPTQNDFNANKIKLVDVGQYIRDSVSEIFSNQKFKNLKYYKSNKGNAFVLPSGNNYYTERNFSSGEINILRLMNELDSISENALILIDEIEMSLHPSAQLKLIEVLKKFAVDKKCKIIFSTHSETVIRSISSRNIYLLINEGDQTIVKNPCYPERALEKISFHGNVSPDIIVCVEDKIAEQLVRNLYNRYQAISSKAMPRVKFIPVGG